MLQRRTGPESSKASLISKSGVKPPCSWKSWDLTVDSCSMVPFSDLGPPNLGFGEGNKYRSHANDLHNRKMSRGH